MIAKANKAEALFSDKSAFFFNDDPSTAGDPALCQENVVGDFPMEPIVSGNITLRR
jgi:hypothetical protein